MPLAPLDSLFSNVRTTQGTMELHGTPGSTSGGVLEFILECVRRDLFPPPHQVIVTTVQHKRVSQRNSPDSLEWCISVDGVERMRLARAYGIRSMRNLVRRCGWSTSSSNKELFSSTPAPVSPTNNQVSVASPLAYVEVMACPSGCINGGAQLKPSAELDSTLSTVSSSSSIRKFVEIMTQKYAEVVPLFPHEHERVMQMHRFSTLFQPH